MTVDEAKRLIAELQARVDAAEAIGAPRISELGLAQALDDAARAALAEAIERAQAGDG